MTMIVFFFNVRHRPSIVMQTIIECLRYSLTGELPPGSGAGRAFIHDPRCLGATSVAARVQLDFREPSGVQVSLHRCVIFLFQFDLCPYRARCRILLAQTARPGRNAGGGERMPDVSPAPAL